MAIISMSDHDPSKRVDKKWVAKATINRVIEIKEKQIAETEAKCMDELDKMRALLMITDKEMRFQTHMKHFWLILSIILFAVCVGLATKVLHG